MVYTRSARHLALRYAPSTFKEKRRKTQGSPSSRLSSPLLFSLSSLAFLANEAQCREEKERKDDITGREIEGEMTANRQLMRHPSTHRWLEAIKKRERSDPSSSSLLSPSLSSRVRLKTLSEETRREEDLAPYLFCQGISICAIQNSRPSMEDAVFVSPEGEFLSLFDGHGGHEVAQILSEKLYGEYKKRIEKKTARREVERSLREAIETIDRQVQEVPWLDFMGSTATVILLQQGSIIAANVGDSRAVLCRNGSPVPLTRDHKPEDPEERRRIQERGGVVSWCSYEPSSPICASATPRTSSPPSSLSYGDYRVNGNLSMSRAIGDAEEKPSISAEPDIKSYARDLLHDEFIVIASDGLWDVMSNEEVCDFVRDRLEETNNDSVSDIRGKMASSLARHAQLLGSDDNISVILVWLK